jgi:methylated-DNA-protein-cysteine methyltransferase-like protein
VGALGQQAEPSARVTDSSYTRIYRVVSHIPRGRVATYGQIAELAGMPRAARQVGYALAALRDGGRRVPWHRVLNARGEVSVRSEPGFEDLQRVLLEREGVRFNAKGRVAFDRVLWLPGSDAPQPASKKKASKKKASKKKTPAKRKAARSGNATRKR